MFDRVYRQLLSFLILSAAMLGLSCDRVRSLTNSGVKPENAVVGTYQSDQITSLDSTNYEAFIAQKNRLMVVDFYADWCGPCRKIAPVLEKAASAHPGIVYIGKVNVDQSSKLASEHGVNGIPDVRIFKDGREVDRFAGFPGEAAVLEKISALSRNMTPAADAKNSGQRASSEPEIQSMKKDWLPKGIQKR